MFLSKEQRDEKKRVTEQISELEAQLQKMQAACKARSASKSEDIENYTASVADKWEYLEEVIQTPPSEFLDAIGNRGWELVAVTFFDHISDNRRTILFKYLFKRRKYPIPENILSKYSDIPNIADDIRRISSEIEALKIRR